MSKKDLQNRLDKERKNLACFEANLKVAQTATVRFSSTSYDHEFHESLLFEVSKTLHWFNLCQANIRDAKASIEQLTLSLKEIDHV